MLEGLVVGAAGGALAGLVLLPLGLVPVGTAVGGISGFLSGFNQVYDWRRMGGWAGFALDSTWGLIGTTLGLTVHAANLLWPGSHLEPALGRGWGYHVYRGGFRLRPNFVLTQGNVVSNAGPFTGRRGERRLAVVRRHEGLHVWQNRIGGPFYQVMYLAWMAIAGIVGAAVGLSRDNSWARSVETLAYYNNPFEYYAYRRDENWPPARASQRLVWKSGGSGRIPFDS